jgi:beta-xylosidase
MRRTILNLLLVLSITVRAQQPDPPGQVKSGEKAVNEAYLFAHMMHGDYGSLYYTVSLDGLHWFQLNDGKRVFDEYHGHPDIVKGHDGRYYIAGNKSDGAPDINLWVSKDLVAWEKYSTFTPDLKKTPNYNPLQRIGAPKLFYDSMSKEYVITWHTPERYWASQRTLYVTSKDLKTFSAVPKRLLEWEMGTIDVLIRKAEGKYWTIIKDETYPTLDWVTGKTIRIASSEKLLGPYKNLSQPVSPNFREAPMLIPSPNNKAWYLYYEQYPGISYGLSVARSLAGPWYQISGYTFYSNWDKYSMPAKVRHGCMITISKEQYKMLVAHFGIKK